MTWSKESWEKIVPIYNKILKLPFIIELIEGTLDKNIFEFYVKQDTMYLHHFGRILCAVGLKLKSQQQVKKILELANEIIEAEHLVYEKFLSNRNKTLIEPSPSCLLYTSFLHQQFNTKSVEVILASLLPCFWIYNKVGIHIYKQNVSKDNPYYDWINVYASEEYSTAVEYIINICDNFAKNSNKDIIDDMKYGFIMSSKFEWMFWDSAFKLEKWPI